MNFSDSKTEQNYVLVHIFCVKDQIKRFVYSHIYFQQKSQKSANDHVGLYRTEHTIYYTQVS